jgi:hypothetical protein
MEWMQQGEIQVAPEKSLDAFTLSPIFREGVIM